MSNWREFVWFIYSYSIVNITILLTRLILHSSWYIFTFINTNERLENRMYYQDSLLPFLYICITREYKLQLISKLLLQINIRKLYTECYISTRNCCLHKDNLLLYGSDFCLRKFYIFIKSLPVRKFKRRMTGVTEK